MKRSDITSHQIINWSKLSVKLTGFRDNIKPGPTGYIPKKWRDPLDELESLIDAWLLKHSDKIK